MKKVFLGHFCDIPLYGSIWKTTSIKLKTFQSHFNVFSNFSCFRHQFFYCNIWGLRNSSSHGDAVIDKHSEGQLGGSHSPHVHISVLGEAAGELVENPRRHIKNIQTPQGGTAGFFLLCYPEEDLTWRAVICKLLADGGQQQLLPDSQLKQKESHSESVSEWVSGCSQRRTTYRAFFRNFHLPHSAPGVALLLPVWASRADGRQTRLVGWFVCLFASTAAAFWVYGQFRAPLCRWSRVAQQDLLTEWIYGCAPIQALHTWRYADSGRWHSTCDLVFSRFRICIATRLSNLKYPTMLCVLLPFSLFVCFATAYCQDTSIYQQQWKASIQISSNINIFTHFIIQHHNIQLTCEYNVHIMINTFILFYQHVLFLEN